MRLPYKSGTVRVSSPYGSRELNGTTEWHNGIDLVGSEKVIISPVSGVVLRSRIVERYILNDKGGVTINPNRTWEWGNYVSVAGDDGLTYYFCHLSTRAVQDGTRVAVGDVIGTEGSTGYSFGSHLHFEVRNGAGVAIDPTPIIGVDNIYGKSYQTGRTGNVMKETDARKIAKDNGAASWSEDAVVWAVENEIVFGDGDGDLRLKEGCTREQMLVFLYRALKAGNK